MAATKDTPPPLGVVWRSRRTKQTAKLWPELASGGGSVHISANETAVNILLATNRLEAILETGLSWENWDKLKDAVERKRNEYGKK